MTGMEHAIEQAAERIIAANNVRMSRFPRVEPISMQAAREYARALASAGLLAPAPLREEWGTRFPEAGEVTVPGKDQHYPFFWKGPHPEGVNVRRYVSDWLPVDRAEGDGEADA